MDTYRVLPVQLQQFVAGLLTAVGTPADIAAVVADHLVTADVKGYLSHGVHRLGHYVGQVGNQEIAPAARPEVLHETPATATVEGHRGWGPYTSLWCMQLAVRKAKAQGIGAVTLTHTSHNGRMGHYTEYAVSHDCIGLVLKASDDQRNVTAVPYGGAGRTLGTNPVAIGVPSSDGQHFLADFATTVYSSGKVAITRLAGAALPPGVILDKHGQPSEQPADLSDGGSLLVFGGYKGYAISLLACLAGGLAGAYGAEPGRMGNATYFQAIDIAAFQPAAEYEKAVAAFLSRMRAVPPASGFEQVLVPGDLERRTAARQEDEGVSLPQPIWEELTGLGDKYGVDWRHL